MTKKQNRARHVEGAHGRERASVDDGESREPMPAEGQTTPTKTGMAKSSPHGSKGVPVETNGSARRAAEQDLDEAAVSQPAHDQTVTTDGPGPLDKGRGRATRAEIEKVGTRGAQKSRR